MPTDANVVPFEPGQPGHHRVPGTDLEVVFDRRGEDLVLRVNKAGVLVFRALLRDAAKDIPADEVVRFSPVAPDIITCVGDTAEGIRRMVEALPPTLAR